MIAGDNYYPGHIPEPFYSCSEGPPFTRQHLFLPICYSKCRNTTQASNFSHSCGNEFSIGRPGWSGEENRRKTFREFSRRQDSFISSVDVSDNQCTLTSIRVITSNQDEPLLVRGKTNRSINLLEYF